MRVRGTIGENKDCLGSERFCRLDCRSIQLSAFIDNNKIGPAVLNAPQKLLCKLRFLERPQQPIGQPQEGGRCGL